LHGPAALWLVVLTASAWRLRTSDGWRRAVWITVTAALGLLLGLHALPGFSNPVILRDVILADGARPYSQYINFDKTLAGVLFLGCSGWTPIRSMPEWDTALRRAAPVMLVTVIGVMTASLALGYVPFDPRWSAIFPVWAAINLLTTCVSEEAFFRGLIQHELQCGLPPALGPRQAAAIAVALSALLFGLAHAAGGWQYMVVATVAGTGYAVVYHRTARLEMAILAHFAVNAVHFLFFTYPALL
jgi:membrane protease YdiL (CAAX protease family)